MRRRWFLSLTFLAFVITLGIGHILWHAVGETSVDAVQSQIATWKPVLTRFRLFLITVVTLAWPLLVNGIRRFGKIDDAQATALLALRWRVVTWLVLIEVLLGQNLIGKMLSLWQGG